MTMTRPQWALLMEALQWWSGGVERKRARRLFDRLKHEGVRQMYEQDGRRVIESKR